jgi:hypothetical protein
MRFQRACVAAGLLLLFAGGTGPANGGGLGGTTSGPVYKVRVFRAEIPPAREAGITRIGVILPPKARVVKVEAFIVDQDYGRRTDGWRRGACDFDSGTCALPESRVARLTRAGSPVDQEVAADFLNLDDHRIRYGKLRVVFQPVGSLRKTYRPKSCIMRTECGFAGPAEGALFAPDPEQPVIIVPD